MSLSQVRRLNVAVAFCERYRLSEDIALLMYAHIILKNVRTGSAGYEQSFKNVKHSTINDENKYKSKDHWYIYFQNKNNGR